LKQHWPAIREQLLNGTYEPQPVRRVEIPKPDGGVRKLGIPSVLDRFIQQAVMQVLQRRWDRTFSNHSYGFRPGRSAHQAVAQAQQYIAEGYGWCVDFDLEKFFDRVNHDKLMGQVAKRVEDKRLLKLIRAFLTLGWWRMGWLVRASRVPHKEVHFRHCSAISCSTNSTGSWSAGDFALFDTRTTVTFTFAASERVKG
jgi:group II intron reverse transcriptase/maturase